MQEFQNRGATHAVLSLVLELQSHIICWHTAGTQYLFCVFITTYSKLEDDVYLFDGCGEHPFHIDPIGCASVNCLLVGKKLVLNLSLEDCKAILGHIGNLDCLTTKESLYPQQLLEILQNYQGPNKITLWWGVQHGRSTWLIPPMFAHCTCTV
jgi:hypothetical protein